MRKYKNTLIIKIIKFLSFAAAIIILLLPMSVHAVNPENSETGETSSVSTGTGSESSFDPVVSSELFKGTTEELYLLINKMKPLINICFFSLFLLTIIRIAIKFVNDNDSYDSYDSSSSGSSSVYAIVEEDNENTCISGAAEEKHNIPKAFDYETIANDFMEKASPGIAASMIASICREAKLGDKSWQEMIKAMHNCESVDDWLAAMCDHTLSAGIMTLPCLIIGPSEITRKEIINTYKDAINTINGKIYTIDTYNAHHNSFISEFMIFRVWEGNKDVLPEPKFSNRFADDMDDLLRKYSETTNPTNKGDLPEAS